MDWTRSVRQKARWIIGISLQEWEQTGWEGSWLMKENFVKDRKVFVAASASFLGYWGNAPATGLSRLQYLDTKVYMPEDILMKVDRMSMACSLETRAPLLDYTVVEFAASIPPELHMKDGRGKYILRKMASRFLPARVLEKKKQGFAIPRGQWFQGALKDFAWSTLTSEAFKARGYFRPGRVEAILAEHAGALSPTLRPMLVAGGLLRS